MLKIILVQGFCPVKSKITQFPNGSGLNTKFILVVSKLLINRVVMIIEHMTDTSTNSPHNFY